MDHARTLLRSKHLEEEKRLLAKQEAELKGLSEQVLSAGTKEFRRAMKAAEAKQ